MTDRDELAHLIHHADTAGDGVDWHDHLYAADAILAAGWRRVVADEDTVERVAQALHDIDCRCGESVSGYIKSRYTDLARAAIQAIGGTDG